MVLESLVRPTRALVYPPKALVVGALYAFVAGILAVWVFNDYASVIMVAFAALFAAPFMYMLVAVEERLGEDPDTHILVQCRALFAVLALLVVGLIVGFTLWYFVSPHSFEAQEQIIMPLTGYSTASTFFVDILVNNLKVLFVTIVFSFLFGLGGIFVLVWNASVVGLAIGKFVEQTLLSSSLFIASGIAFATYMIHGIPELLAYFVAGVAGSILSVAMMRKHITVTAYHNLWVEITHMFLLSVMLLVLGAVLEAYFIPLMFR